MKLKHLKALCKTLEDYENKCGDAEIDFRNNRYEIYKTEIINSDTTYYYRLKQKE